MSRLIFAALAQSLGYSSGNVPDEIVYLPEGEHKIFATVDGKPGEITVKVPAARGEQIAAALQASLTERGKSNVRPWLDFEHKRGAASGLPVKFRYESGKGVMCSVEWTGAGRAAIEGKDFSYFSPEFLVGDDGIPNGLPTRGPLGALVNEPAFREIPRVAAANAESSHNQPTAMSKLIFAALAISAAAENAETEAVNKIEAIKTENATVKASLATVEKERDELKTKVAAAESEIAKVRKDRADSLVKAAVADGRIAPKDDEMQTKFRTKIEAGDTFAEEILAKLPKSGAGLDKPIVNGAQGVQAAATGFEAKAESLVKAGQAKTIDEAFTLVAASEPALYADYLKSLDKA